MRSLSSTLLCIILFFVFFINVGTLFNEATTAYHDLYVSQLRTRIGVDHDRYNIMHKKPRYSGENRTRREQERRVAMEELIAKHREQVRHNASIPPSVKLPMYVLADLSVLD
ncbi:hypothetical protein Droror1_Dr00011963 [Drosera rotundifolia]